MTKQKKYVEVDNEAPEAVYYERPNHIQRVVGALPRNENCLQIYRMALEGKAGRPIFLSAVQPAEVLDIGLITYVKNHWGGGRFKFEAVEDDKITDVGIFEIEGKPIIEGVTSEDGKPKEFGPNYVGDIIAASRSGNNVDSPITREELSRILAEISSAKEGKVLELLKEVMASQAAARTAALNEMAAVKTMFDKPQSQIDAKALMDFAKEVLALTPSGEGGNSGPLWLRLLDRVTPLLNQITGALARAAGRPQPGIGMALAPGHRPADEPVPSLTPAPTGFKALAPMFQPFLPTFLMAAANDKDPAEMIDLITFNIPPDKKDAVTQWLQSSDWLKDLIEIEPRIGLQQAWWMSLHRYLLSVLLTGRLPDEEIEEGPVE